MQLVIGRPDLQALLASRKLFPISKQLVVGADHELRGDRDPVGAGLAASVMASQVAGAIGGTALADAMFAVPALAVSRTRRGGGPVLLGEVVATAGLLLLIVTLARTGRGQQPPGQWARGSARRTGSPPPPPSPTRPSPSAGP